MRIPKPTENMDEIWSDFYATLKPTSKDKWVLNKEREGLIHFAWLYNWVASTGTLTPVYDLAVRMKVTAEEVGELVERCLELKLLNAPKRGTNRCELSMIAVRMIMRMGIGI